jgi:hypothetical protein
LREKRTTAKRVSAVREAAAHGRHGATVIYSSLARWGIAIRKDRGHVLLFYIELWGCQEINFQS